MDGVGTRTNVYQLAMNKLQSGDWKQASNDQRSEILEQIVVGAKSLTIFKMELALYDMLPAIAREGTRPQRPSPVVGPFVFCFVEVLSSLQEKHLKVSGYDFFQFLGI